MDIEQLPKLDLHCHLDGSLTKAMIEKHLGKKVTGEAPDCIPGLPEPYGISGEI